LIERKRQGRHDADDSVWPAVEHERLADDRAVTIETLLPEVVVEQHDIRSAGESSCGVKARPTIGWRPRTAKKRSVTRRPAPVPDRRGR